MKINIDQLKEISNKVFDDFANKGIVDLEIMNDYYWCIDDDQLYETSEDPSCFSIGQLSDDYLDVIKDCVDESISGHTVKHLASLLMFLASESVKNE